MYQSPFGGDTNRKPKQDDNCRDEKRGERLVTSFI